MFNLISSQKFILSLMKIVTDNRICEQRINISVYDVCFCVWERRAGGNIQQARKCESINGKLSVVYVTNYTAILYKFN